MLQNYLFPVNELQSPREIIFQTTSLGKLRQVLPLDRLAALLPAKGSARGAKAWLAPEGMLALLFLKSYTGLSDEQLIEHLNGNWQMQLFCGMRLADNEQIKDVTLVSRIRSYVAKHLDLQLFQEELIRYWKPQLKETQVLLCDATVYESDMKYPTSVKLLWDCCLFSHELYEDLLKSCKLKRAKNAFNEQQLKQSTFNLLRKKSQRKSRRRCQQLIKLLTRLNGLIKDVFRLMGDRLQLAGRLRERFDLVEQVLKEQRFLLENPGKKLPDRVLSLYKPFVRSIVRGKENKPCEFGAKVHMLQVDGINIIEHYSYAAYNECKRVEASLALHGRLFGTCHQFAGDRIYATNANRKYLNERKIATGFVQKGRGDTPEKKTLRALLNKERSTRLEGSFGTEKNHYDLRRIKARNQANETLWMFFGVMTAVVRMVTKREKAQAPDLAA
ncbi:transposase [Solitalea lacus]|uniref:transposase n=1 Tax=Solitalea lacus TaxID=2911172 RepID=UPI001EDB4242|nr:transposase [Solitalea lacus]UKJ08729.1 transposase [Solitalea lacus]